MIRKCCFLAETICCVPILQVRREKHPLVAERKKHHALVIDFGGGTFDVCVIATTKEGDINISEGKRMARPLSASSNPIGGFFVNRVIAEEIIRKPLTPRNIQAKIDKAFEFYRKWRKDGFDLSGLTPDYRNFASKLPSLSLSDRGTETCIMQADSELGTRRASQPFPFQLPLQRTHLALHPRQ